ncbi:hypothetical protein, partial [Marinobacter excellens]|uniref:hypothetical protein n=1 Tax=Marinobacter excellens TaxID=218670 RepID=UPI0022281F63
GSEIFFRLDVLGQLGGHGFEFFLIHLCTHDGILLKRLLSRGQLHNLVYSLMLSAIPLMLSPTAQRQRIHLCCLTPGI